MAADVDYYVMSDTSAAGRVASNSNDGRDPWGHNQTIAATVAGNITSDENFGTLLTLPGDFAAYWAQLVARGGVNQAAILALADHAFISAFTGAATATAGNVRLLNCSASSATFILTANAAYNAGTTYAVGDRVTYGGYVWRSRLGSNTANTPSTLTAAGQKYWERFDIVMRGQAVTTDLTGLSAVVLGTGPKLTIAGGIGATAAGNRLYICGDASGIFETPSKAASALTKASNYGTRLNPVEVYGADWYGKARPLTIDGARTTVRPATGFTLNDDFITMASSAANVVNIRGGIRFDGADSNGVYRPRQLFDGFNTTNDLCSVSFCTFAHNNGSGGYQAYAPGDLHVLENCIFEDCAQAAILVYGTRRATVRGNIVRRTVKVSGSAGHGIQLLNAETCEVSGNNSSANEGDGIRCTGYSGVRHLNNIHHNNMYANAGDGFNNNDGAVAGGIGVLTDNSSTNNGGYGYRFTATVEFTHIARNHAWNNTSGDTNLSGGLPGVSNPQGDAQFLNAAAGDFTPKRTSPLLAEGVAGGVGKYVGAQPGAAQSRAGYTFIDD